MSRLNDCHLLQLLHFSNFNVEHPHLWISLSLPSLLNFSMYSLLYRSCVWHCSSNIFIVSLKASIAVLFIWISWKQIHDFSVGSQNILLEFLSRVVSSTHLWCSGVLFIQTVILFVLLLVLLVVLAELPANSFNIVFFHHLILRKDKSCQLLKLFEY